jgi:hypothetical protein
MVETTSYYRDNNNTNTGSSRIGRGAFTIAFLQQQGSAFQYTCDSIIY